MTPTSPPNYRDRSLSLQDTPASVKSSKPTYLKTIVDLQKNALAELGSLDEGSYKKYMLKMIKIAVSAGITKPQLTLGFKYIEGSHPFLKEQPYAIKNKDEWTVFKTSAELMFEYTPRVFVIDGSKFLLP